MPTIKQLETALVNADRAGDEEAARALAAEIRRMRAQGAKPAAQAKPKAPVSRTRALVSGAVAGFENVANVFSGAIGDLVDKLNVTPAQAAAWAAENLSGYSPAEARKIAKNLSSLPGFGDIVRAGAGAREQRFAPVRQERPNYFTAGKIIAETATTAPFISGAGGLIAKGGAALSKAPTAVRTVTPAFAKTAEKAGRVIQRVGRAVQTGGIGSGRTAAQTAALSRGARVGQLAERMAGGAIAGGAGAALTGQDVQTGATFGAGLPVVASVLKRVGGFAGDITKLPRQKAAEIIRKALGDKADEARAVFAQLSPGDKRLAEQVLIEAGVEPDPFFGIGKVVQEQTVAGAAPMREALEAQAQTRAARLAQTAAGETATGRRAAAELARQGVSEATSPLREGALQRANVAGQAVPAAEQLAALARQQADEQSGFARRMILGADRAETALGQMDDLGDVLNPEAINRQRGLAGAMTQRGEAAAQQAIGLRQQARDMEDVVADLAAKGMQPLRVAPIVNQLRSMAAAPGTRADKLQRSTLTRLANELEGLGGEAGVIDARDLYQIRKTGVNDIVDRLLGSRAQPASGTKERTASLLTSIRPMIDEAIEGAGGTGWKDYLTRTRQGFETVNRQELAAKGAQLAQESPNEFIALMRGERPKIVEDIMGPGTKQYDIAGMALADPQRYLALKQSADEFATLNRMAELRASGTGPAGKIMVTATPTRMSRGLATLAGIPYTPLGFAARGGEQVERAFMAPRVERELAGAYLSGPAMGELLNTFPMKARISEAVSQMSPQTRNFLAQLLRGYSAVPSETNYPE